MSRLCSYCQTRPADKMVQPANGSTAKRRMCDPCIERRIQQGRRLRVFKQGEPK